MLFFFFNKIIRFRIWGLSYNSHVQEGSHLGLLQSTTQALSLGFPGFWLGHSDGHVRKMPAHRVRSPHVLLSGGNSRPLTRDGGGGEGLPYKSA